MFNKIMIGVAATIAVVVVGAVIYKARDKAKTDREAAKAKEEKGDDPDSEAKIKSFTDILKEKIKERDGSAQNFAVVDADTMPEAEVVSGVVETTVAEETVVEKAEVTEMPQVAEVVETTEETTVVNEAPTIETTEDSVKSDESPEVVVDEAKSTEKPQSEETPKEKGFNREETQAYVNDIVKVLEAKSWVDIRAACAKSITLCERSVDNPPFNHYVNWDRLRDRVESYKTKPKQITVGELQCFINLIIKKSISCSDINGVSELALLTHLVNVYRTMGILPETEMVEILAFIKLEPIKFHTDLIASCLTNPISGKVMLEKESQGIILDIRKVGNDFNEAVDDAKKTIRIVRKHRVISKVPSSTH